MEILQEDVHLWLDSARFVKSKPGVYVLYDKKLEVLYIGHSDNLQNQFAKYLDTNFEGNECKQRTHNYQRSFTDNPEEQQRLLLEKFKEEHGKLPVCNSESLSSE